MTRRAAMIMNSLNLKIGTNNGPINAPTPKAPCENPTHIPISSAGATFKRLTLTAMRMKQQNRSKTRNIRHCDIRVCMKYMAKHPAAPIYKAIKHIV